MPELPEVEIIRLGLQRKIVGLTFKNVQVLTPKTFQGINGKPFDPSTSLRAQGLRGKKVLKVWRRAKILGIDVGTSIARGPVGLHPHSMSSLNAAGTQWGPPAPATPRSSITLLFHLKMTGQLIYDPSLRLALGKLLRASGKRIIGGHPTPDMQNQMPNKSTRVIFEFSDSSKLYFNDQRKFGWIKLVDSSSLIVNSSLKDLGPEPLEKGFTWQVLKTNLLRHKNLAVKVALMDQKVVSGVGNIYANEACFNARVDPRTKVSQLTDTQFKSLQKGVVKALKDAIKHGGSSRAHFVDSEGKKGYFLEYAYVYGRAGMPCKICGTAIQKVSLGGRGTYLCEHCQM